MLKWFKVFLWAWALLPLTSARAFVDPPTFEPTQPVAGQPVRMSVRAGECHGFGSPPAGYSPTEVSISNNTIKVLIFGIQIDYPDFCLFTPGIFSFDLGPLPGGDYNVTVQLRDNAPPFAVTPVLSSAPLNIRNSPATAVPSLGIPAIFYLGAVLLMASGLVLRRQIMALALVGVMLEALPSAPAQAQEPHPVVWAELEPGGGAPGAGMLCKITA